MCVCVYVLYLYVCVWFNSYTISYNIIDRYHTCMPVERGRVGGGGGRVGEGGGSNNNNNNNLRDFRPHFYI